MFNKHLLKSLFVCLALAMTFGATAQDFTLQILHNNDGESNLFPSSDGYGGAAQFLGTVNELRFEAWSNEYPSILLSSGDNFIPGKNIEASLALPEGEAPYDSRVFSELVYDALCIGNHDFDLGPDFLARIIEGMDQSRAFPKFLSANLDYTGEPALQALVEDGRLAKSTIIFRGEEKIGVIGLTTPNLDFISAPRNVEVMDNLAEIVAAEVAALEANEVNKIILISHLQGVEEDTALATMISGVDVVIAGGGDDILANNESQIIPGDEIEGAYPLQVTDADGETVYVVTTGGGYRYLGNLTVTFDAEGKITSIDEASGPVPVIGKSNPTMEAILVPVAEFTAELDATVVATTEVALDGRRNSVRGLETNEGNLIADALLWQANQLAEEFGVQTPDVALANGGGIRNNNIIEAGSELNVGTTFDILPFGNIVTIMEPISAAQFKLVMENAVSRITADGPAGSGTGRFAQVAGFTMDFDFTKTAVVLGDDGAEVEGERVQRITLNDGTVIVENGAVVDGARDVVVVVPDFIARGGDQYPFGDAGLNLVGVTGQKALQNYLEQALSGVVTAAMYPEGGEGRINTVTATAPTTVVDVVVNSDVHNTLEAAVIAADLAGTLSGEGPFTVFAPTDAAFAALPEGTVEALLADIPALTNILTYHVLGAKVLSTDLSDGLMATTLLGEDVTVTINENGVFINDAQVTIADIETDNGVVHVIDAVLLPPADEPTTAFDLTPIGTYNTGVFDESAAEIVAFDTDSKQLYFSNSDANSVGVLNIDNPAMPMLVSEIDMASYGDGVQSVAVYSGLVAVATEGAAADANGKVVFFEADGTYINDVEVGVLPDMLVFTNDGMKVLTANEGEPNDDYTIDPEGSVSIIDVSAGAASATVTNVTFESFNPLQSVLTAQGLRIYGPNATLAQDVEPEFVTISPDNSTAFVTLQENNAVAVIDIASATAIAIIPIGTKDHSMPGNGFDASNRSEGIDITTHPTLGMYQPDAIKSVMIGGSLYLVTANEGDSRDYDGYSEEVRVADLTLDPTAYPDAATLQADENLGRLKTTTATGDIDGDGDIDQIYSYGARSFTIWDGATGALVYDSGDAFETITAMMLPEYFNSSNDETGLKDRSDDKGPEPEALEIVERNGSVFALIGLERVGGIFVYDITDPTNATFVNYVNNRNFEADPATPEALDLGVEEVIYISAADSPNGQELVVTSNEVSGTVTVFGVGAAMVNESAELFNAPVKVTAPELVAYPNPATDNITLEYSIANTSRVAVTVFDMMGRQVATVVNATLEAGAYNATLSTADLNMTSGMYFVTIQTNDTIKTLGVTVK